MKKNYIFTILMLVATLCFGQVTYNGNTNTGFGGPVGGSSMTINDDGTTVTISITKGPGDFNDALVLYLDTKTGGRTAIDANVEDNADGLRTAISNGNSSGFGSTINFPSGFDADYAIAVNTAFGGLWEIPATGVIGNNGLNFIASTNSTLSTTTQASFTMTLTWTDLGLTGTESFNFVGLYLSTTSFNSDEAYGGGIPAGNSGGGDLTFTSFETYSNTLSLPTFDNSTSLNVKILGNELIVTHYSGNLTIKAYNILGKEILRIPNLNVNNTLRKSLNLPKNQISIVVIETANSRQTLKVVL